MPQGDVPLQTLVLKQGVQDAFLDFLNIEPNIVAEFLAKFLDFHLKKSNFVTSDDTLSQLIEEVLTLFRIVSAKDVFAEFYQRALSRRLLLKKSACYDSEKAMILRLKTECGDTFITKVEGMLKDLSNSEKFMKEYAGVRGEEALQAKFRCEANFHVLGSSSWPI